MTDIVSELPRIAPPEQQIQLDKNPVQNAMAETTKGVNPPGWFKNAAVKILNAWFEPKSYENEKIYEKVGIKAFKKYMPTSGDLVNKYVWKKLGSGNFVDKSESSLKQFETFTRLYETIHLAAFTFMVGEAATQFALGNTNAAAFTTGLNILVNAYPIMLQRYNRIRLYKVINKFDNKLQDKKEI